MAVEPGYAPRISVTPGQSIAKYLGLRLGVLMLGELVVGTVAGVASHNQGLVFAAPIVFGVMAAIFAVEMPLIVRAQRRRYERSLSTARAGTLFVGRAVGFRPGTTRPASLREGVLLLDSAGLTFLPTNDANARPDLHLPWAAISEIDARPFGGKPQLGKLSVTDLANNSHGWRVRPMNGLAAALTGLRDR